jgi:hypothetical protein
MTPSPSSSAAPTLSLILCSRNDAYMGNARWRLETTLNFIAAEVAALGAEASVEVVVADWGSDQPLSEAVALDPIAARITSFLTIPPDVARAAQRDSPFAEVIALNAAARRARGAFIGRIDQDTLVGRRFLKTFLAWASTDASPVRAPLEGALWFANRRSIPYQFAVRSPEFVDVSRLVRRFGHRLRVETAPVFYRSDVGIWLLHRDLWEEAGGYDERMIYMNDMEIDMATRLMTRYPMVDLGPLVAYDFYHLDHYHPGVPRKSSTHRPVNAGRPREDAGMRPSGANWGLATQPFEMATASWCRAVIAPPRSAVVELAAFGPKAAWLGAIVTVDRLRYAAWPAFRDKWTRRARIAGQAVTGQPLTQWPGVLRKLWGDRPSAKAGS